MKKRVLALLVTLLCALCFAACDGDAETPPAEGATAHTHVYENWQAVTAASCSTDGTERGTCACGATDTRVIPKTDAHTYEGWQIVTAATCSTAGVELGTCDCGNTTVRPVSATGEHVYMNWQSVTPSTCVSAGSEKGSCSCGETATRPLELDFDAHVRNGEHICTLCKKMVGNAELCYTLNEDGTSYRVSGYTGTDTSLKIPAEYHSLPVTMIGEAAFQNRSELTSVSLPASLVTIGANAFDRCSKLETVTFAENCRLTTIGACAFKSCYRLRSITLPTALTIIEADAFAFAALSSVTIPAGVTSLGGKVVYDDYETVSQNVFRGCIRLETIVVESGNTVYYSTGNCLIERATKTLIVMGRGSEIPTTSDVIALGALALACHDEITSIEIPSNITVIGNGAFHTCVELTSVSIPAGVTFIGQAVFDNCSKLDTVILGITAGWWVAKSADATSGSAISEALLQSSVDILECLRTYDEYYWKRG